MAFLFVKELTSTSGDTIGDGKGVEVPLLGCPEAPPAQLPLDFLIAHPDLLWNLLTQVEKALAMSSQIFLRPLLVLPIQGCILMKVEISVGPPEMP